MSLSIEINKEEDIVRFSNSPSIPLIENKKNKLKKEEKQYKIKPTIFILSTFAICLIIIFIVLNMEKENEVKWNNNKIFAIYEINSITINVSFFNEKYKNISDFIETMKLNDIIINNTQYYSFNSTGNYTLEIIFKKPLLTTEEMFKYCHELTDINLTQFHTGEVENMTDMFNGCDNLKNVNMKNIYAPKLKNIGGMFSKCY